jgi:hypothetical protein
MIIFFAAVDFPDMRSGTEFVGFLKQAVAEFQERA